MEKLSLDRLEVAPIDYSKAYFGEDYTVNQYITIHQPRIGEIIQYGERNYWGLVNTITAISSDMKSELAAKGIYWGDVQDFEIFKSVMIGLPPEKTSILFGDLDFRDFGWYKQTSNDTYCLYNPKTEVKIDVRLYSHIFNYIATIHGIKKVPEFAGNMITRQFMIEEDAQNKKAYRDKPYKSTLMPLASFLVNSPGNSTSPATLKEMPIFQFFDSVKRVCTINSANMLIAGIYQGRVNPDKVPKRQLDGLRDLYDGKA